MRVGKPKGKLFQAHKKTAMFWVFLLLITVGVVLVNGIAVQLSERYALFFDLTENEAYHVGEETRALLSMLNRDVEIFVLMKESDFSGGSYVVQVKRILEQYPQMSRRISLKFVDTISDPGFTARFAQMPLSNGDTIVVCGDRVKRIPLAGMFFYLQDPSGRRVIQSSRAEEALTSAIQFVTDSEQVRIAFIIGNGTAEKPALTELLSVNNLEIFFVNPVTEEIDDRYAAVFLLSPQIDISENILKKFDEFLYNEGKYGKTLFYATDVSQPELPNVAAYLKEWGILVGDGAVFETQESKTYQYQPFYPVTSYESAIFQEELRDRSMPVIMPLARPLELLFSIKDAISNEVLLTFSSTSGVKPSSINEGFTVNMASSYGPYPAMILSKKTVYKTNGILQSNLVVMSSSAMFDGIWLQNTSFVNGEYFVNLLNTVTERNNVINIQPKSLSGRYLTMTTYQASVIGLILAGIAPLTILGAGIVVWLIRRYG